MSDRRVVVTGVGVISALGLSAGAFWEALSQGRPGIAPIEGVDCSPLRFRNGAEVHGYNAEAFFDPKTAGFMDRFAQFALIAAREAVTDAGVDWTPGLGNAPLLAESVASFQCRSASRYYGGDHVIFLGAVEAYSYNRKEPLLFARGGYGRFLPADGSASKP